MWSLLQTMTLVKHYKACHHDADNDAVHLARAAKIVLFKAKQNFDGSFGQKILCLHPF